MSGQGAVIDRLVERFYKLAIGDGYGFAQFAVPWGRKESESWRRKKILFDGAIRQFAKDCGVMAMDNRLYTFNGKIYEPTSSFAVCQAYDILMSKLGIADVMSNKTLRKEAFLDTIVAYNQLEVRNDLVAFSNKVVDFSGTKPVEMGKGMSFDPKWHVLDYRPYRYDPSAKAPKFMDYLKYVLPDKIDRDVLQMFMGLGLVRSSSAFKNNNGPRSTVELCLVMLGSGANGKSVLFNIMCALFGRNHITSIDYETITSDGDEGLRGRAAIRSAVFNWSSDSDPKKFGMRNTAMFKRIVSGEPYPYRLLGEDIRVSSNCPYLIFSLNELPNINEGTHGFIRRLQFVNFQRTVPRWKQNPTLAQEIITSELPGVFNWVLRGAKEIRRRKFHFPATDANVKTKMRSLLPTNPVSAWSLAYHVRGTALAPMEQYVEMRVEDLYQSMVRFVDDNDGGTAPSKIAFSKSLQSLGFTKKRSADGVRYVCYGVSEKDFGQSVLIDMFHEDDATHNYAEDYDAFNKED